MNRRLAQGYSGDVPARDRPEAVAVVALGATSCANPGARLDTNPVASPDDRVATIDAALSELAALPLTTRVRTAAPIETVAPTVDGPDASAPASVNTVALVTTRLAPSVLLAYLHAIEARHGRAPRTAGVPRCQDRTLDLDLIAYGELQSSDPRLRLPHPRAAERDVVLAPWLAVDPDAVLPGEGRVADLLARPEERS
ncbi:MAG: 2-amino-4-hydroxy-6-hydroxymethyldihydropteridine diphosphokinase [Microbacterium sp.]